MSIVSALFVAKDGVYDHREGVDPWHLPYDARTYEGPHPVVAHPPCKRWGRYWGGGPSHPNKFLKGQDGSCFSSALHSVRLWGGVLEHPAYSSAWAWHGLAHPPIAGRWVRADRHGWTCHVEQIHYGHRARKATWLYAVRCTLPELQWGEGPPGLRLDPGYGSKEAAKAARASGNTVPVMSAKEAAATPRAFADLLLSMARSVYRYEAPTQEVLL